MSNRIDVSIIGDGSPENPHRPDYSGAYDDAVFDHQNNVVSITPIDE